MLNLCNVGSETSSEPASRKPGFAENNVAPAHNGYLEEDSGSWSLAQGPGLARQSGDRGPPPPYGYRRRTFWQVRARVSYYNVQLTGFTGQRQGEVTSTKSNTFRHFLNEKRRNSAQK